MQFHIVFELAAGEGKQLPQAIRIGDHGRTGVEGEPLILVDIGPAAGLVPRFENRRV